MTNYKLSGENQYWETSRTCSFPILRDISDEIGDGTRVLFCLMLYTETLTFGKAEYLRGPI